MTGQGVARTGTPAEAGRELLSGVPDGLTPLLLARLAEAEKTGTSVRLLHVARDDRRLEALAEGI